MFLLGYIQLTAMHTIKFDAYVHSYIIASTHKTLRMHLFYMLIVCAFVATLGQSNSSSVNLEIAPPLTTTSTQPLARGLLLHTVYFNTIYVHNYIVT